MEDGSEIEYCAPNLLRRKISRKRHMRWLEENRNRMAGQWSN
jgi:hypothetical protein